MNRTAEKIFGRHTMFETYNLHGDTGNKIFELQFEDEVPQDNDNDNELHDAINEMIRIKYGKLVKGAEEKGLQVDIDWRDDMTCWISH